MNLSNSGLDVDIREALFNDRATGPAYSIQLPLVRITRLHGILFDLDPKLLQEGNVYFPPAQDTRVFYDNIRPVLDRHPLARNAEVRSSGTGLHLILSLQPVVELHTDAEQHHWDAIIRVIQRTLPVDPDMPGITALTRPIGSTNRKNGAKVEALKHGDPVNAQAVEDYMNRLAQAPFKEVALSLLGSARVSPCPVCGDAGTRLDILDYVGKCYNGCSKVTLDKLYDRILKPLDLVNDQEKEHDVASTVADQESTPLLKSGGSVWSGFAAQNAGVN